MKNISWIIVAVLGILIIGLILVAGILFGYQENRGWGMMGPGTMGPGMMNGWGFGFFGWFGMLLMWLIPVGIVTLVILGIIALARGLTTGGSGTTPQQQASGQSTPHEILQIRYARGEITRDQYLEILDDLS